MLQPLPINCWKNYALRNMENPDGSKVKNPFSQSPDLEADYHKNLLPDHQKDWIPHRLGVLNAAKKIVSQTIPPFEIGAEFGCGGFGFFRNYLVNENSNLIQLDINPGLVASNKKYTKHFFNNNNPLAVANLYKMPLKSQSVDLVAGFNSWDSIFFFNDSVKEIKRCLKPGGNFYHAQIFGAAEMPLVVTEAIKRKKKGLEYMVVPCGYFREDIPLYIPGTKMKIGGQIKYHLQGIYSIGYGKVRLGEYLIKHLSDVFSVEGFNIQLCEERIEEALMRKKEFKRLLRSHGFKLPDKGVNSFAENYGFFNFEHDLSINGRYVKQAARAFVFCAKKPVD